jgi:plastocyanin
MRRWLPVLLLALVAASCSKPAEPPAATPAAQSQPAAPGSGNAVVSGRAPRGSLVRLEPATPREFPMPAGPVIMDQYGKAFVPEVLIARLGQTVEFRNSEDIVHNVIVVKQPTGRSIFDISGAPFETFEHKFAEPGVYAVSCDIHPGMRAALVVTTTPYAVVADAGGAFTLQDVVPGAYTLLWSGDGRDRERRIDVAAPRTEVNLTGS